MIQIDENKKITVSFGGTCKLGCAHCYTNTTNFVHQEVLSVDNIIDILNSERGKFSTICISGDTDCFLEPFKSLELIKEIIKNFFDVNIMFTTRLIPPKEIVEELIKVGNICNRRKQLFIPCISVITYNYPNKIENGLLVPSTIERLNFFQTLISAGLPCFLTLRPTFPFEIVPLNEIIQILDYVKVTPAAVLGEVLLLDKSGILEKRLGIDVEQKECPESKLTFIYQPLEWKKMYCNKEHSSIKKECVRRGLPFFMRSMSAIKYLKKIYTYNGIINHQPQYFGDEICNIFP